MKDEVKVLLVDDDEENYFLTKFLFGDCKSAEYRLEWSNDEAAALERMKTSAHDIYLIDNNFGQQDGPESIRRAIEKGCGSPIILLAEKSDADIEAEATGAAD